MATSVPVFVPLSCGRIARSGCHLPSLSYTTTARRCPRPWLQRQPRQTFATSLKAHDRVKNDGPLYRGATAQAAKPVKDHDTESVKPESFEKLKERDEDTREQGTDVKSKARNEEEQQQPINDPLLQEQTKSNKEQRKADWAIIKEMSKYLWPKDNMGTKFRVGASVALLIGAKVSIIWGVRGYRLLRNMLLQLFHDVYVCLYSVFVGSECSSAFLLQVYR